MRGYICYAAATAAVVCVLMAAAGEAFFHESASEAWANALSWAVAWFGGSVAGAWAMKGGNR